MRLHHWMWWRNYKTAEMLYVCWCYLNGTGKNSVSIDSEQKWKGLFGILWVIYQNFHMIISNTSRSSELRLWEVCIRDGNCSSEIPLLCCGTMPICKFIGDSKGPGNIAFMSIFWQFSPKDRDSECTETLDLTEPCWVTQWSLEAIFQLLRTVQLPQVVHLRNVLSGKRKRSSVVMPCLRNYYMTIFLVAKTRYKASEENIY